MRWRRVLHLKSKLILLAAASGAIALVLACAGFVFNDFRLLRETKQGQLRTQAALVGFHSEVALTTGQSRHADELLESLRTQPSIELAGLYDANGNLFAQYSTTEKTAPPARLGSGSGKAAGLTWLTCLEHYRTIHADGRLLGTVYLRANLHDLWEQLSNYAKVSVLVMFVALAAAVLFASMMQRSISGPILQLAETAQLISASDDYSIRVQTDARDEIGLLYSSFNRMVEQVQASRDELERGQDDLERRVDDRTYQLQEEIEHREQVQRELLRAKESAESASRAKSNFLANMSHEIRTPLNAILGFTDLLRRGADRGDDAERRDFLDTVHHSGEHLLTLINDILDLSKIEAGQMEYEQIRFSPHQIIAEVMSVMRARAQQKGLALEYNWYGHIPETIESDPARFRQLLLNLVGNAIKFTEHGAVQAVAKLNALQGELTVDIIDTGIGISPEMFDAVFSPFTQADSSVTRRFGGTGLGLSICKHISVGLGGGITVQSEPGYGSTFSATIATGPLEGVRLLQHPAADILPNDHAGPAAACGQLNGQKILVVDDGDTNRKLIRLVLSRAGADVVMAENGLQAVEATREHDFDMVLMDMQMPVMDGYTATGRLRDDGYDRPIVALTAHAMRGDAERCLSAGCSDYLTKPINPDKLLEKISAILAGSSPVKHRDSLSRRQSALHAPLVSELPTDDPEFAEIVHEFIGRAEEKVAAMHTAYAADNNMAELAELSHWLKGAGGTAGFPILTETARQLESAISRGYASDIEALLNKLDDLIGRIVTPELVE
jgi:signal transduction histidine kinase/DNA-binding NarL/FixJ family response regulator